MSPEDMDFQIIPVGPGGLDNDYFSELLGVVASHVIEDSIPGRELKWVVMEKNTGKFVGFIRFGSPTINSKPRNIYLGGAPDLEIFNRHACMGFIIVPTQPFGFNYLRDTLLRGCVTMWFGGFTLLISSFLSGWDMRVPS